MKAAERFEGDDRFDALALALAERDATIRDLAADLALCQDRLARAEHEAIVAAKGRDAFLATAAHELRNALATLVLGLGAIERTLAAGGSVERMAKNLESSKRSVGLLRCLLDDMQDGIRFQAGPVELQPAPADLATIAGTVVKAIAGKAQRAAVPVTLKAAAAVPGVWDAERIERALFHVLQNSLRYGGGTPVEVAVSSTSARAQVSVQDGGPGIDPADQARIFEPFVRGSGQGEVCGLGLGLFIARRCVEAHGGTIAVESKRGAGARFTIELPREAR